MLNVLLTVVTSFFLSVGNFWELKGEVFQGKKGIGTLKLSGENFAKSVGSNITMLSYPLRKHIMDLSGRKR